jgi:hypothetical protein
LGYQQLLDWAYDNEIELREKGIYNGKINTRAILSLLPSPDVHLHSASKRSLMQDVAGNLASYFELSAQTESIGFPVARSPYPEAYENVLDDFVLVGSDVDDYSQSQDQLSVVARGQYMPVYFAGADGATRSRYFSLLERQDKCGLYAVLFLLPQNHELCQSINAVQGNLVRLDTGGVFTSRSKSAIIVPLEVGRNGWQFDKFIVPSADGMARTKSATLVKSNNGYFLHVAFEFEEPTQYEPAGWLGIDKGILFTAAYAMVDDAGAVLDLGHFDDELRDLQIRHGKEREVLARNGKRVTKRHYKRKAYDAILHGLVNELIAMAQKHQLGIAVEDLNIQVKGSRVVSRFRKLDKFLEYKCKLAGVPFRRVFAAYSSMICHKCGADMKRSDRVVVCTECGYEGHSDDNAAVNIARRPLYRKKDWNGGYREFHRSFNTFCRLSQIDT